MELILLSPYRLPTQSTQMLANDDVASFLNGYICLWHPAAASGAARPPIVASPYDYEQPRPGQIFAVPESPPLVLPDDWDQRVLDIGALAFRSTPARETTLANFQKAMKMYLSRGLTATQRGEPDDALPPGTRLKEADERELLGLEDSAHPTAILALPSS